VHLHPRRLAQPEQAVAVEVALIGPSALDGDLAVERGAEAIQRRGKPAFRAGRSGR
jgi:hypothetical protein